MGFTHNDRLSLHGEDLDVQSARHGTYTGASLNGIGLCSVLNAARVRVLSDRGWAVMDERDINFIEPDERRQVSAETGTPEAYLSDEGEQTWLKN